MRTDIHHEPAVVHVSVLRPSVPKGSRAGYLFDPLDIYRLRVEHGLAALNGLRAVGNWWAVAMTRRAATWNHAVRPTTRANDARIEYVTTGGTGTLQTRSGTHLN